MGVVFTQDRKRSFRTGMTHEMTRILQETIDGLSREQSERFFDIMYRKLSIHD